MPYNITLINPPVVFKKNDPFGDIPFMPTGILYLAGFLNSQGIEVSVIDGFGNAPERIYTISDSLMGRGMTEDAIISSMVNADLVGISIHSGMSHSLSLRLAAKIRTKFPGAVIIAGGSHASVVHDELLSGAFDYVCIGEGEYTLLSLIKYLRDNKGNPEDIPGLVYSGGVNPSAAPEPDLDKFGFARFDALPLKNYWDLGMSHAPVKGRFISITTSRGCPFNCSFCTTPKLFGRKWRSRSPVHIVDEIESAVKKYGIEDIIIQDDIFGFKKLYAKNISREILRRNLKIRLYLPSGIKAETFDAETLFLLSKAGLKYMCLAPESGSQRILKKMNKPMDFKKLYQVIFFAKKLGIKLGCFFILGFGDENKNDRKLTKKMIIRLARMGVDEVSLFIWTPLPGAHAFKSETGWSSYEDLNWSPGWRSDYRALSRYRKILYMKWFSAKLIYSPMKLIRSLQNVVTKKYELKSEMALYRLLHSYFHYLKRYK